MLNIVNQFKRHPLLLLYVALLMYVAVFSYIGILKHNAFMSTAWDLGIYEQAIWSTANTGRLFWYTAEILINPSCNFLGIHFSPILFLVVPIYAIFQSTETLIILQASILGLAAIPLYKLVVHETHSVKQGLTFAFAYLAYPPINSMNFFDFHVQAFLPLFFFSAFYYFRKEEWVKYFVFTVLALMVIEIVPVIVVFFGLYGLWTNRKKISHVTDTFHSRGISVDKSVVCSFATIALGVAWFALARTVTFSTNPTAPPNPNWSNLGDPTHDLPGFMLNVFTNPFKTIGLITTPLNLKAIYILGLFEPVAFLSFLSPPSLMIGAPWFIIAFLSNYTPYYAPLGYQYTAFVAPFIFISAIYGANRLKTIRNHLSSNEQLRRYSHKLGKIRRRKTLLMASLFLVLALSYIVILGIRVRLPVVTSHDEVLDVFIRLIPSNASVLTQNDLFPHISRRLYVYALTAYSESLPANVTFDYIFVDKTSSWYVNSLKQLIQNFTAERVFGIQYAYGGILLLKKGYTGETINPYKDHLISL